MLIQGKLVDLDTSVTEKPGLFGSNATIEIPGNAEELQKAVECLNQYTIGHHNPEKRKAYDTLFDFASQFLKQEKTEPDTCVHNFVSYLPNSQKFCQFCSMPEPERCKFPTEYVPGHHSHCLNPKPCPLHDKPQEESNIPVLECSECGWTGHHKIGCSKGLISVELPKRLDVEHMDKMKEHTAAYIANTVNQLIDWAKSIEARNKLPEDLIKAEKILRDFAEKIVNET